MNTKSRISVPIELSTLPADDQIRPVPFNTVQIIDNDGPAVSGYVSFTALRKQAIKYITGAIQYYHDLTENNSVSLSTGINLSGTWWRPGPRT